MKLFHGIVTYNRLDYLKMHIESWIKTHDTSHEWRLVIADDGSTDGTVEYLNQLKIAGVTISVIFNSRRGPHHQVNTLLLECSKQPFDMAFIAEDDTYFIRSGWDNLYADAINLSGYQHLCYFNKQWVLNQYGVTFHESTKSTLLPDKKVQSQVSAFPSMGCFWTVTPDVLTNVGYFDLQNLGVSGNGHTDYTIRCCKAGFNTESVLFDAYQSEKYIAMQDEGYHQSLFSDGSIDVNLIGVPNNKHKGNNIAKTIYCGYNECKFNMLNQLVGD